MSTLNPTNTARVTATKRPSCRVPSLGPDQRRKFAAKCVAGRGPAENRSRGRASLATPLPSLAPRTQVHTSDTTTAAAEMGQAGLKTCCLYAALLLLSSVILLTSFTIQWILYSIQFSLVSGRAGVFTVYASQLVIFMSQICQRLKE